MSLGANTYQLTRQTMDIFTAPTSRTAASEWNLRASRVVKEEGKA